MHEHMNEQHWSILPEMVRITTTVLSRRVCESESEDKNRRFEWPRIGERRFDLDFQDSNALRANHYYEMRRGKSAYLQN